jgi:hypothetical protein
MESMKRMESMESMKRKIREYEEHEEENRHPTMRERMNERESMEIMENRRAAAREIEIG